MTEVGARTPLITRDTMVALIAVVLATALAWWWLATSHTGMPAAAGNSVEPMPGMDALPVMAWTPAYAFSVFLMWAIMMVAMMLPSATPMILLHARTAGDNRFSSFAFLMAYLGVWTGFSAVATAVQWLLASNGWLNEAMQVHNRAVAATVLAGAGVYQLTPIKQICLSHCRSPLSYLIEHWRPGLLGAVRMGVGHGAYCVGCCWFVMALLFVGGVMNLTWIVTLAVFVMAERLLPFGDNVGKVAGLASLAVAVYMLSAPV